MKSVQISENTELLEARAGSVRRWSAYGAAFGAAATGAVTLGTLGVVGSLPGPAGLVFGFVLAMGAGGVLGARWKALVARDRGWLSLAGWARRFGLQGFCWGALCAAGGTAVAWSALGLGSRMHLLLWGLMAWAGVAGGLAGAHAVAGPAVGGGGGPPFVCRGGPRDECAARPVGGALNSIRSSPGRRQGWFDAGSLLGAIGWGVGHGVSPREDVGGCRK